MMQLDVIVRRRLVSQAIKLPIELITQKVIIP